MCTHGVLISRAAVVLLAEYPRSGGVFHPELFSYEPRVDATRSNRKRVMSRRPRACCDMLALPQQRTCIRR
jgi:hypothetical protein